MGSGCWIKPRAHQAAPILLTRLGLRERRAPQRRVRQRYGPSEPLCVCQALPPTWCLLQNLRTPSGSHFLPCGVVLMILGSVLQTSSFPLVCPSATWGGGT